VTSLVVTMAGRGSRFRAAGFTQPKFEIRVHGRTLFSWSVSSLRGFAPVSSAVFVALRADDVGDFVRSECESLGIACPLVVELDEVTEGQAASALAGMHACAPGEPVAIFNIDTHVRVGAMASPPRGTDGHLPCFRAEGDHWSFVRLGDDGEQVVEVREKRRISPLATTGLYWFRNPETYRDVFAEHFCTGASLLEAGEAYIAPMYNTLIARGGRVTASELDPRDIVPLGTPAEVARFAEGTSPCP
jgi:dTDP-glucose pyrophosphorylase